MSERFYYVYILSSRSRTLYIGLTNLLRKRVWEHRIGAVPGFTSDYRIHRLMYFEQFNNVKLAIAREKQLKGWRRSKKVALIESKNPAWDDLAEKWFESFPRADQEIVKNKQVPRFARDDK